MNLDENSPSTAAGDLSAPDQPACRLTRTQYLLAGGVGLITPIPVVLLYLTPILNDMPLFLIVLLSGLYLFNTFRRMIVECFDFKSINLPIFLFFGVFIFYVGITLLSWPVLGASALAINPASATLLEQLFFYATIAGLFGLSASISFISFELGNMEYTFLLLNLCRLSLFALGLSLMGGAMGILLLVFGKMDIIIALAQVALILNGYFIFFTYSVICLLLGLIFVLMAYRPVDITQLKENEQ